jgi:hypothetical protein
MSQLDRQLVFGGAYGSSVEASLGPLAGWTQDNGETSRGGGERAAAQSAEAALHATFGNEASSAWFMPFNMEPPEIGAELGVGGVGGLDGFAGMFGNGGMTPNGSGLGGMHHGGH